MSLIRLSLNMCAAQLTHGAGTGGDVLKQGREVCVLQNTKLPLDIRSTEVTFSELRLSSAAWLHSRLLFRLLDEAS